MERENVRDALMRLAHSVQKLDDERWKLFSDGESVFTDIIENEWQLHSGEIITRNTKTLTITIKEKLKCMVLKDRN